MPAKMQTAGSLHRIRFWISLFMIGLVLSGITAFPLESELRIAGTFFETQLPDTALTGWIAKVRDGLIATNREYPFIAYGTDWLAFAHLVIALAFIGPLRDPVRNVWVIEFGMIACACVIPLALICGPIREIPFWWRMIDCSFGIFGIVPLWICRREITRLTATTKP